MCHLWMVCCTLTRATTAVCRTRAARFGGDYPNTGRYGAGIKPSGPVVLTGPVRDVVVNLNVTGSASAITDFEDLGGKVVIPAGTNRLEVMFVPLDDPQLEFEEI